MMTNAEAIIGEFITIPPDIPLEGRQEWSMKESKIPKFEVIDQIGVGPWNVYGVEAWEQWVAEGGGPPAQGTSLQHAHTL
jgi:hypothetical protein